MYHSFARELRILNPVPAGELAEVAARLTDVLAEVPSDAWSSTIARWLGDNGHILPRLPAGVLLQYLTLFCGHADLLRGFKPPRLRAPLAGWHASEAARAAAGWSVGGANVLAEQVVVGAHYDLMQPPLVNTLASELAAVLARIEPS
jgi:thioesterase domain-containing protein